MKTSDAYNLQLAESQERVDTINKKFYGTYTYPWPPMVFDSFADGQFWLRLLHQDMGDWSHRRIPLKARIWVAGCGTNQAVYTALKFPQAQVLGTDLSAESLQTCRKSAQQIGIRNLRLEEGSLNDRRYEGQFDYVICTGVIHHNADPSRPLKTLCAALKPQGVLELMVYNFYHRLGNVAFQKAVRTLCGKGSSMRLESEMPITRHLVRRFPLRNYMARFLEFVKDSPEEELADALLQPVEHSYTVESLQSLAEQCGLDYLLPCLSQFDKAPRRFSWNMDLGDPEIQKQYDSLPDAQRWQIANLLMFESSPMLWFYLQRKDSGLPRISEKEACQGFLQGRFERNTTAVRRYVRDEAGAYRLNPKLLPFPTPPAPADHLSRRIFEAVDSKLTMKDIFDRLGIETAFSNLNHARLNLTTTAFPYLRAVG